MSLKKCQALMLFATRQSAGILRIRDALMYENSSVALEDLFKFILEFSSFIAPDLRIIFDMGITYALYSSIKFDCYKSCFRKG